MELKCLNPKCESATATRDKKWLPEKGYDPLMRRYTCDGCGEEVYLSRGRRWKVASSLSEPIIKPKRTRKKKDSTANTSDGVTVIKEFDAVVITK